MGPSLEEDWLYVAHPQLSGAVPREPVLHHCFRLQRHLNTLSTPNYFLPAKLIPTPPFLKAMSTQIPAPTVS